MFLFAIRKSRRSKDDLNLDQRDGLDFTSSPNGRLYQTYLGNKLVNESEFENLSWNIQAGTDGSVSTRGWEVYPCSGAEDYFEPAFAIQHNDGNMTSIFKYVSSESKKLDNNVTETIISLKDDVYPVEAKLHYVTFAKENVIKAWTEIRHMEKNRSRLPNTLPICFISRVLAMY